MNNDLLAPPKLTVRRFAIITGVIASLAFCLAVFYTIRGSFSLLSLGLRTLALGVLIALSIWGYAWLMRRAKSIKPERMPFIHAVVALTGYWVLFSTSMIMLRGTFVESAFSSLLWMIPFMFGMTLAMGGVTRRVGDSLHCPKCEYEFAFDDAATAPIRCPECGSGWLGILLKGRRIKSPKLIVIGASIAILGMIVFQPIFYMGTLAPHLPTPLLAASLYVAPTNNHRVWDELAARTLDEGWIRIMAQRVLRERQGSDWDRSSSGWFDAMIAAGTMPPELVDRYYREGFAAELAVPARVKAGEPFEAKLRVTRAADGGSSKLALYFAGYALGDDAPLTGRKHESNWGFTLQPGVFEMSKDVFPTELTADKRGPVRVRAVYWVVYQPSFGENLEWQADGTPVKSPKAMWFERVEMERTVIVE